MGERLTGRTFRKVLADRVLVDARDLVNSCAWLESRVGARYVWESLTSPVGQLARKWSRLDGAIVYWCGRARECGLDHPEAVVESFRELQELRARIAKWAAWGSEISV